MAQVEQLGVCLLDALAHTIHLMGAEVFMTTTWPGHSLGLSDSSVQLRQPIWTEGRKDTRAGSYERQLHTKAGEVMLQVPKLRSLPFETAIMEGSEKLIDNVVSPCIWLSSLIANIGRRSSNRLPSCPHDNQDR